MRTIRAGLLPAQGRERIERDRGYTLVELLVVVVIIGITAALGIGGVGATMIGLHNSLAQATTNAARVALGMATIQDGAAPAQIAPAILSVPTDSGFKMGYHRFWQLNPGQLTGGETLAQCSGATRPAACESDFAVCSIYGDTIYVADTWHDVSAWNAGAYPAPVVPDPASSTYANADPSQSGANNPRYLQDVLLYQNSVANHDAVLGCIDGMAPAGASGTVPDSGGP